MRSLSYCLLVVLLLSALSQLALCGESDLLDILANVAEGLSRLGELDGALTQVQEGKIPTFETPLGDLAERLEKAADKLDKEASALSASAGNPSRSSVHHPGAALTEMSSHLNDLHVQQRKLRELRDRLSNDKNKLKQREMAASRLSDKLEKFSSSPLLLPEQRPQFDALSLDSDRLHLAISSCITSITRVQQSVAAQLPALNRSIENLQANLDDPHLRSIITALDASNVSIKQQTGLSIQAAKAEMLKRDQANTAASQWSLQHPHSTGPPPQNTRNRSTTYPNILPPLSRDGGCPAGYRKVGETCVKLDIQPH